MRFQPYGALGAPSVPRCAQVTASSSRSSPQNTSPRATKLGAPKIPSAGLTRRLRVGARNVLRLRECDHTGRVLADLAQRAGKVRLAPAFLLLDEPAPVGRAHVVGAPAFLCADDRHAVGEIEVLQRVGRLALEREAIHLGAPVQVAPHVFELLRLCGRPVVHLDHDGAHRERPVDEAHVGYVLHAVDAHDGQERVHAADGEPEIDRVGLRHSCPRRGLAIRHARP